MIETWYAILVGMLTAFVVLEGWDFGCGLLHFAVGRNEADRGVVLSTIGPMFLWNEVWLVAFGGVTFVAFPIALASAFSGFYLALFLVLWCLILRGVAIEVRGHSRDPLWREGWDFTFAVANVLLAVLVGVALGNVIRGVPVAPDGSFTLPFFTDFGVRGKIGILDWYTISFGMFSLVLFAAHGASYLVLRTVGTVHDRSEWIARLLWPVAGLLIITISLETRYVRPDLFSGLYHRPLGWLALLGVVAGGAAAITGQYRKRELTAFAGSCVLIASLMAAGAVGVYPMMLLSTLAPGNSITAYNGGADAHGLKLALIWWVFALALTVSYCVFIYRNYRGKVNVSLDTHT